MRSIRTAGLLFAALAVLLAGSARADAPLKYADDPGDALDGRASLDIVSVTYDLRQVNKVGPKSVVIEMELGAPPEGQLASYSARAEIEGCGFFDASFRPGSVVFGTAGIPPADFFIACGASGDSEILDAQFRIDGNVLRWSIALDGLPKEARTGKVKSLNSFTQIAEPATGIMGTGDLDVADGPLPIDAAASDKTWSF